MHRLVAVVLTFVVACGGATVSDGADSVGTTAASATELAQSDGEPAATTQTPTTLAAQPESDDPSPPPATGERLSDYLPFFGAPDEEADEVARRREMSVQESISDCMDAEGFEYIPFVNDAGIVGGIGSDLPRDEYAATYGFGMSTTVGIIENQPAEIQIDPNQAIVDRLDAARQEAYNLALYGPVPTQEELESGDYEGSGCLSEAFADAFPVEIFDVLGPAFEEMSESIDTDPRILQLEEDWSACMASLGFDFADQDEMFDYLFDQMSGIVPLISTGSPTATVPALTEDEAETLKAVQDEEIAIALADVECSEQFEVIFDAVAAEYEAVFIAENRAVLEEYRDSVGG